jgi:nicotinate-nucleotide pyrophosphorylase (carboxylating)
MTDVATPRGDELARIIDNALAEDIGQGDITSALLVPADQQASMDFVAREPLVACGGFIATCVYERLDVSVRVTLRAAEGIQAQPGSILANAQGPARALLAGERVALNLMQRMSGIATLTARYAAAIAGSKARLLDTRKTMPGLRLLDKYAVRVGGGHNHRLRLDDMVLIKDNHIALAGGVAQAVALTRSGLAGRALPIVVECDTLAQVQEALACQPDRILLDNMTLAQLREAVALAAGRVALEASGGISLETIGAIAQTGVDCISVGKLTHSAMAADIGADIHLLPSAS